MHTAQLDWCYLGHGDDTQDEGDEDGYKTPDDISSNVKGRGNLGKHV